MSKFLLCVFIILTSIANGQDETFALEQLLKNASSKTKANEQKKIVTFTKRIKIKEFPKSYNPSIIKTDEGYLLIFRYLTDPKQLWLSKIGVVLLDAAFNQVSTPELIDTRVNVTATPSQSEDARVFSWNDKTYLIFNDSLDLLNPNAQERRDMYISELSYVNNHFVATTPRKLFHAEKYKTTMWQKNWVPFVWNDTLLLAYSIHPHEILLPDLSDGVCEPIYITNNDIEWNLGHIRGGTPAILVDGEYLSFFHSCTKLATAASGGKSMWHYFMGAYTFSKDPPFEIKKVSQTPVIGKNFYTNTDAPKRVIFPGGVAVNGSDIIIAYGKDDCEVWVAILNKEALFESLVPVSKKE